MSLPILAAKLNRPSLRRAVVDRGRLLAVLNRNLRRKLTLVSAPAGFGKTTLVLHWLADLDEPVSWLSLDDGDNDPHRFLTYLVAALQRVNPETGRGVAALLAAAQPPSLETLWIRLLNEITEMERPFLFVLDDLHRIEDESILEGLARLVANQPDNLHLVITTREDPPLPLARLRARGELVELRAQDLRFTREETALFLDEAANLGLTDEQITTLARRTEGWVAGLQMAAISVQGAADQSAFIAAFSGTHRYIMDFLSEEVLRNLPPETCRFLLQTSILERMSGPLCAAVTGRDDSVQLLQELEAANLFIMALDNERNWYRYHHLFAQLLQRQLHRREQGEIAALHRRAAHWYEAAAMIPEALHHAQAVGDEQLVADMVEVHAMDVIKRGYVSLAQRWFALLPESEFLARSRLNMNRAWAQFLSWPHDLLSARLLEVEAALAGMEDETAVAGIRGEIATMRAYMSIDDPRQMKQYALQAMESVPADNYMVRGLIHMALANVHQQMQEKREATVQFEEAIRWHWQAGNQIATMMALLDTTQVNLVLGRLQATDDLCRRLSGWMEDANLQELPTMGMIDMGIGTVLLHRYRLPAAITHLRRGIKTGEVGGYRSVDYGQLMLTRALIAAGKEGAARQLMEKLEASLVKLPPDLRTLYFVWIADAYISLGNLDRAGEMLEKIEVVVRQGRPFREEHTVQLVNYRHQVHCLFQGRKTPAAADLLARLRQFVREMTELEWNGYLLHGLLLRAFLLHRDRFAAEARHDLQRALELAAVEEEMLVFAQEAALLRVPLSQLVAQQPQQAYARAVVEVIGSEEETAVPAAPGLVEPLSEREYEVLQLMTAGLTYKDIAAHMTVSVNTVRYHVKGLYGKLGVSSRADALARAREIGLL